MSPDFAKNLERPEFPLWSKNPIKTDITLKGKVVHGFKRGSKELGVPTANIEMTPDNLALLQDAVPGVYMAKCHKPSGQVFKAAVSVGWNPVYNNSEKTVEAYLIADSEL